MTTPSAKKIKLIKPENPDPDYNQPDKDVLITMDITEEDLKSRFASYKKYCKQHAKKPERFFRSCDFNVSALLQLIEEYTQKNNGKAPRHLRVYYGIESLATGKDDVVETKPFLFTAPVDDKGQIADNTILASYAPCPPRGNCLLDPYTP